jgi:D-alanine transfer protein
MALGHAYHQELSILAEVLSADEYLEDSKICVIISPGWFATKGTNTSAFVEFIRPNILKRIIHSSNIEDKYKLVFGKYIQQNATAFSVVNNEMSLLRGKYLIEKYFGNNSIAKRLNALNSSIYPIEKVSYKMDSLESKREKRNFNFDSLGKELQQKFVSDITNNELFVYDDYYSKYLKRDDGRKPSSTVSVPNLKDNPELEDFKLLLDYLKSKKTDCSFVLLPLNPYYYKNLDVNDELISILCDLLDESAYPYLNMHVSGTDNYEPATLKDVMHTGDYGWMKINQFLYKTYYE